MNRDEGILFSGGAAGAEAAFGACAERHGIEEVNFTFEGHKIARHRGVRVLNHEELQSGDVSLAYVSRLMHRRYADAPTIRKVLQTLWYQVNSGQEIYVIGTILDDGTVRGGTGWGAEFAKLCNKPLHVFDQEKNGWFTWSGEDWEKRGVGQRPDHHATRISPAPARARCSPTARARSRSCSRDRSAADSRAMADDRRRTTLPAVASCSTRSPASSRCSPSASGCCRWCSTRSSRRWRRTTTSGRWRSARRAASSSIATSACSSSTGAPTASRSCASTPGISTGPCALLASVLGLDEAAVRQIVDRHRREPTYRPITIVQDATLAQVAAIRARRLDYELPDIVVEQVPTRTLSDAFAAHCSATSAKSATRR